MKSDEFQVYIHTSNSDMGSEFRTDLEESWFFSKFFNVKLI